MREGIYAAICASIDEDMAAVGVLVNNGITPKLLSVPRTAGVISTSSSEILMSPGP